MSHLSANKTQPQKLSIGRYALVSDQGLDLNIHILKVVNVSTKDIQYHMILKIEASNGTFEQSVRLFPINQVWQTC